MLINSFQRTSCLRFEYTFDKNVKSSQLNYFDDLHQNLILQLEEKGTIKFNKSITFYHKFNAAIVILCTIQGKF